MAKIQAYTLKGTIDDSGDAVATTSSAVHGYIEAIEIDYPAATCTVDIDTVGGLKSQKILDLAAASTDAVVYPRVQLQDNTGSDLDLSDTGGGDTKVYGKFAIADKLKLTVASGTADQVVKVRILVEER